MRKKLFVFFASVVLGLAMFFGFSVDTFAASNKLYTYDAGESDTAIYKNVDGVSQEITLKDLQSYYLDHNGNTKSKTDSRKICCKYKNFSVLNDVTYLSWNDPITSFIPEQYFRQEGDFTLLGKEYGFYIRTEEYPVGGVADMYYSQVFLMDFSIRTKESKDASTMVYFDAYLVVNTAFLTINIKQFKNVNEENNYYLYDEVKFSKMYVDGIYRVNSVILEEDSKLRKETGYVTVPVMEPTYHYDSYLQVGPEILDSIKMYTPSIRVSTPLKEEDYNNYKNSSYEALGAAIVYGLNKSDVNEAAYLAALDKLNTYGNIVNQIQSMNLEVNPSNYEVAAEIDNSNLLANVALTGTSLAGSALPFPYSWAVKGLAAVGKLAVNKGTKIQKNLVLETKNLQNPTIIIDAPEYCCHFDTFLKQYNGDDSSYDTSKYYVYSDIHNLPDHKIFSVLTYFKNTTEQFSISFDCTFIYAERYTAVDIFPYRKDKIHLTVTGTNAGDEKLSTNKTQRSVSMKGVVQDRITYLFNTFNQHPSC